MLVAGAGAVAGRRIAALLAAGAQVQVVAPHGGKVVRALVADGALTWAQRAVRESDLDGAWLVLLCTDDPEVQQSMHAAATAQGRWCLRADDALRSDGRVPAATTLDGVTVAVWSGDPGRSVALRDAVADRLPDLLVEHPPRRPRP